MLVIPYIPLVLSFQRAGITGTIQHRSAFASTHDIIRARGKTHPQGTPPRFFPANHIVTVLNTPPRSKSTPQLQTDRQDSITSKTVYSTAQAPTPPPLSPARPPLPQFPIRAHGIVAIQSENGPLLYGRTPNSRIIGQASVRACRESLPLARQGDDYES